MQDHHWPQHHASESSCHSDPREKDRYRDVEDKETQHSVPVRSCELRGQTRDAESDQRNPRKSRKNGSYPVRSCRENELRLDIRCEDETDTNDNFYPRCNQNGQCDAMLSLRSAPNVSSRSLIDSDKP